MTSLRYNIFNQVHKGLRALLYDTSLLIQQTSFSDADAAAPVLEQIETVMRMFESHAQIEDTQILPMIEHTAPNVAAELEAEHITDHRLSEELRQLLIDYRHAASEVQGSMTGFRIQLAFQEFTAFNLSHMNKEEIKINEWLWKIYADSQLKEITEEIVSRTPPEKNKIFSYWMMKGLSDSEIANWLDEVQATAPAPVYNGLLDVAEVALPAHRWVSIYERKKEQEFAIY